MKIRINQLTNYNCILLLYNIYNDHLYDNLYQISTCLTWSIFYSFHFSVLLNKDVFKNLRKRNNISFITFHMGNIVLHILPYCYVLTYSPNNMNITNSLYAILLNVLWCYISTNGSMDLSNLYISLSRDDLRKLYFISFLSSLLCPVYYNISLSIL